MTLTIHRRNTTWTVSKSRFEVFVNWGGILLHLRRNIEGWVGAGSKFKYLRFITGRHDLPFYYKEEVEVQRRFLDAFLKGDDHAGWADGTAPKVDLVLRKGDVGFNNSEGEKTFSRRVEHEWPIARTEYTRYYLKPDQGLATTRPDTKAKLSYRALGNMDEPQLLQFKTTFEIETEVTGHLVAHLNVSLLPDAGGPLPTDIDLFHTLRHLSSEGMEILYTGIAGDGVPLCKGWLRVSLRKPNPEHARHRSYLPYRDYLSSHVLPVLPGETYPVDGEIWPTNVVLEKGDQFVVEVVSGDTHGYETFQHNSPIDRSPEKFAGQNFIHFSSSAANYVTLPIIPQNKHLE
ncbi:galactose-binding domain-like protein [Delphinella strobiligena]|nr:galactose-binding domain-like protein [Delphinella strobiligena]